MSTEKDIFEGYFGSHRFASSPHTFRDDHLSRDFCENQLEIITPVCERVREAVGSDYAFIAALSK